MRSPNSDISRNNIEDIDDSDVACITISSSSSVLLGFANELDEEYYDTEPNSAHSLSTVKEEIITIPSDSNSGFSHSSDLELIDHTMRDKDMTSTEKVTNWQTFQYHYKNIVQKDTGSSNRTPLISRNYITKHLDKQCNTVFKKSLMSSNSVGSNKSSVIRNNNASDPILIESPKLNVSPFHQKAMSSQSLCSPRSILPSPSSSMIQIRNSYMQVEAASKSMIQVRESYLENDYSKITDSQSNKESTSNIINNNRDRKEELLKYLGIDSKPHIKIPSEPENVNYAKRRSLRCLIEQSKINHTLKGQPTNNSKYDDSKNTKKQQINSKMNHLMELKKNEKSLKPVESTEQKMTFKTLVQNKKSDVFPIQKVSEKLAELTNHNCVNNNEIKLLKIDLVSVPTVSLVHKDKDKKINGNNILDKKSYKVNKKIRSNGVARFLIKRNNRLVRSKTARVPLRNGKFRSTLSKTKTNDKNAASEKNMFSNKKKILPTCFNGNSKLFSNGAETSRIHENSFKFKKKSSDVSNPTPSLSPYSSGISSASLPVTPIAEALQVTLNNPLVSTDGYVLKAFYCKNSLVIVQEKAISFWSYSRISMIFGIKQDWEMLGRVKRVCNDLLIKNQSNNICYKDNKPVYVEFYGKETKDESRTSPFSSIYLNLYSLQSYDFNGHKLSKLQYQSIQMDGIWR